MEDYDVLNISDFDTENALQLIIKRCVLLRVDYWKKFLNKDFDCVVVQFDKTEDQILILRKITKQINKALSPTDDLLNLLTIIIIPYHNIRRLDTGRKLKKKILQYKSKGIDSLSIISLPPKDSNRDDRSWNCDIFNLFSEVGTPQMYYANKFFENVSSDEIKSSLQFINEKRCNHCFKEDVNKKCSKCFVMYYCSVECQKLDYKEHKIMCPDLRYINLLLHIQIILII